MRQCRRCKKYMPVSEFVPKEDGEDKNKYYFWCNDCREKEEEPSLPNWQDIVF